MALKPTIFKIKVSLTDLDRNHYDSLNLTIAQHPSETTERMMVRLLAYCLNADEYLSFTKGLSATDEPDIWSRTLDGQLSLWIDVGEPSLDRLKKASRQATSVKVYCFNTRSTVWWPQIQPEVAGLPISVYRFDWPGVQALAGLVERTMDISVTITGDSAYVATSLGECEVVWQSLQG